MRMVLSLCTAKLTPVEISYGIRRVMAANPELTVKRISKALGLSKSYTYRLLKLTDYKPGPFYGGRYEEPSADSEVIYMDITSAYPSTLTRKDGK